jgi:hypothetical protein
MEECPHCHEYFNNEEGLVYILGQYGVIVDHGCAHCMAVRHPTTSTAA